MGAVNRRKSCSPSRPICPPTERCIVSTFCDAALVRQQGGPARSQWCRSLAHLVAAALLLGNSYDNRTTLSF